jgi:hypothetical protein
MIRDELTRVLYIGIKTIFSPSTYENEIPPPQYRYLILHFFLPILHSLSVYVTDSHICPLPSFFVRITPFFSSVFFPFSPQLISKDFSPAGGIAYFYHIP